MKNATSHLLLAAMAAALNSATLRGAERDSESKINPLEERSEFGTVLGHGQYSNTLGWALPFGHTGKLYEVRTKTKITKDEHQGKLDQEVQKRLEALAEKMAKANDIQLQTDYTKLGLGTSLAFENDRGSAVLLRVRKNLQLLNEKSEAASFLYIDDREAGDAGSQIEGALMLDWYFDYLYNRVGAHPLGWIDRPYRVWFRTGLEIDKNDLPGNQESDQRKWMALANFQANPDQNARFLGVTGWEITSPQFIQLGAVYEENLITGEDAVHWIVGWTPNFVLNSGGRTQGLGLNKRMYFSEWNRPAAKKITVASPDQPREAAEVPAPPERQGFYTSFNPEITFLGESTARGVVQKIGKVRSLKSLEKLQQEQVRWEVKAILGYTNEWLDARLSYIATGSHPIASLGDGHIGQEARFDFSLMQWKKTHPNDWGDLTTYVSYKRGQFEPNFQDVDLVMAGVSLRF